jgi:predicted dehydrogenase
MALKIGIIGCGSITEFRHAPEYAENPNAEIVAFCDPNRERAARLAELYGGIAVDDYKEIIWNPDIDAISDCSPNHMHHIVTTEALYNKKHVLCEKPMSITLEGARRMVEASKKSGRILMIGHNQRLADAHVRAREIIKSGELGRVITFSTTFGHKGPEYWSENKSKHTWFFNKNSSVFGVAGDLGIHKLDLLRFLLEDEITEVSSFVATLDKKLENGEPIGVSDNMLCLLKTQKGVFGTLAVSWTYYGPEDNCTILHCEKGIMKIYGDPDYQIIISKLNGEQIFYKIGKIQTNDCQSNSGVIDAFIRSILNNEPPLISGEDGYKGLQIILAALESSAQGIKVAVN